MPKTFALAQTTLPASGTFDLTSAGFGTCKGAVILLCRATALDTRFGNNNYSLGMLDGTNEWCMMAFNRDAQAGNTYGTWAFVNTYVGELQNPSTAYVSLVKIGFNSFITDGIRLEIDSGSATGSYITALLIGGDGSVHVGTQAMNSQDVATNYTGAAFTPTAMLCGYNTRAINTTGDTDGIMSFGGYNGTSQGSQMWFAADNKSVPTVGVQCHSIQSMTRVATYSSHSVEATSFNADGFTAYSRSGNAATIGFMLLDDCVMHVGNATYATSGVEEYTGASAQPLAAFELSSLITGALDTDHQDSQADGWGIAMFDGTSEHVLWNKDDDGASAATDAGHYLRDACVEMYLGDDSAEARGVFSSFLSNGRKLTMSDYPASAYRYIVMQFLVGASLVPVIQARRRMLGHI